MPIHNPWPRFVRIAVMLAGLALLVGLLLGQVLLTLLVFCLMVLGWHLYNLARLEVWLRAGRKLDPPRSRGLWGDVFDALYRQRRRQRERYKKLQRLVKWYRDSAKAMPDAVVLLRRDFRIDWWNQAASELLGLRWPVDEAQRIGNIYRHPDFLAFLEETGLQGGTILLPAPVDEDMTLEIRFVPYGKRQYLLLARDVSRVQRLETMRRDFVANVSHELRTPLTVIYGIAETLEEELQENPDLASSARLLRQKAERMKVLVEDLLMLARLENDRRSPATEFVDVPQMLRHLVDEASLLCADSGHEIRLELETDSWLVGAEAELQSGFGNLIGNAIRHTPPGCRVTVRWFVDAQDVCMQVADNGPGIARHHLSRLTERFYRVDNGRSAASGGTGLGLAIVKHVLLRHGGQLDIVSQQGRGSRFTCRFPASRMHRPLAELVEDEVS